MQGNREKMCIFVNFKGREGQGQFLIRWLLIADSFQELDAVGVDGDGGG